MLFSWSNSVIKIRTMNLLSETLCFLKVWVYIEQKCVFSFSQQMIASLEGEGQYCSSFYLAVCVGHRLRHSFGADHQDVCVPTACADRLVPASLHRHVALCSGSSPALGCWCCLVLVWYQCNHDVWTFSTFLEGDLPSCYLYITRHDQGICPCRVPGSML